MAEKFSHAACKQVVEEICALLGFHAIKNSSSDVLADVIRSFVVKIGESSVQLCQTGGRNEPNFYDVSMCLKREMNLDMRELYQFYESLATTPNKQPQSQSTTSSSSSNNIKTKDSEVDLSIFDVTIPPFPKPVPSNLVSSTNEREQNMQSIFSFALKDIDKRKEAELTPSLPTPSTVTGTSGVSQDSNNSDAPNVAKPTDDDENGEEEYEKIMAEYKFLPALPPKHTYSFTPVYNRNKAENSLTLQQVRTKHRRMVQTSLTRIHTADLSLNQENADGSAPEQSASLLYNMIPELTEEPPQPKAEDEDRMRSQKTGKVVNPYLVVVKQRNMILPTERRTARELDLFGVDSEELGLSDAQYDLLNKPKQNGEDSGKKKKSKRRRSERHGSTDEVSYALRKPVVATDLHGIDQMLPPSKKAKTSTPPSKHLSDNILKK